MRSKLTLALSAAAVALGLGAWSVHRARAPLRQLAHELERIEASPDWQPLAPSPLAERVQAELREARDLFELQLEPRHELPPAVMALVRGDQTPAEFTAAREFLERARPFVLRVEHTLADPEVQAAMDRGERLAVEPPKLFKTRMYVNVICAAAVVNAREGREQRAGELLALARDYAYAVDDRRLISAMVRAALESVIREQVTRLLELELVDPAELRRLLEPGLRGRFDEGYRADLVRRELGITAEALGGAVEEAAVSWQFLTGGGNEIPTSVVSTVLRREDVLDLARLAPDDFRLERQDRSTGDSLFPWTTTLGVVHEQIAEDALLRIQLAAHVYRELHGAWPAELGSLASLFPDGVPLDPHSAAPFAAELHGDELRIGPAAIAAEESLSWERAVERGLALGLR